MGSEQSKSRELEGSWENLLSSMDLQFRPRNYDAERQAHALPRTRANNHPLSPPTESSSPRHQVDVVDHQSEEFFDPLRGPTAHDLEDGRPAMVATETTTQHTTKEWTSFKRFLMQRFPVSKMISISSASDGIVRSGKALEKSYSHTHMEELDEPEKFADDSIKSISPHEYVSQLNNFKDKIVQAWDSNERVTSLKLTIKVAKLLMDTSVTQFYPTLFVLATDVLDMLGDLVWKRIKQKAEFSEDGAWLCSLPVNFQANDVCFDAKETCNNWFCKLGSIKELLPRIYLELALLPCWRFLLDKPADCLFRLVKMIRGVADPLASSYCRLYMAHCAWKLPSHDADTTTSTSYLVMSINDSKQLLVHTMFSKNQIQASKDNARLLISLMEPTIEYVVHCILDDASQEELDKLLAELGLGRNEDARNIPSVSIFLHQVLKKLPADIVSSRAMDMIDFIEGCSDAILDQCLNYRLLGIRLSESTSQMDLNNVVYRVIQIVSQRDRLDEYLKVVDAYVDIVLQNHMDIYLTNILEGISNRASNKAITEDELATLQSILLKLLLHFKDLEDMFSLDHFLEIVDMMCGTSRNIININILNIAIRKGFVCDKTTIHFLVEICQALSDSMDPANMREDDLHPARLISRFINMADFGSETERQFAFLVECRGAFGSTNEVKEALTHSNNSLAIRAMKDMKRDLNLIKSCIAFSEVTIPSISAPLKQLNLYLETAEVALLTSLVSHSEGLIDSALSCIESLDSLDGSLKAIETDAILSSLTKVCGLLVMVPGNSKQGITYFLKRLLALVDSLTWMAPRMRTKMYCATLSLSATLSQNSLPYYADNPMVPGNDLLYFGDSPYLDELVTFSEAVIKKLVEVVGQEPSKVACGSMALETCNCIALSFKVNPKLSSICLELLEAAKLCRGRNDKYVNSIMRFIDNWSSTSGMCCG